MKTIHLLIRGKVQGVYYRVSAKNKARSLDIGGWVRNTDLGDVEAVISASDKQLEDFIAWCRQGPENARVDEVKISEITPTDFNTFEIKNH